MTTNSPPPESSGAQNDVDKIKQMEETMKKMQATIDSLQQEVTTLRKDKSTGHTRSTNRPRRTLQSVARRLDMNDGEDEAPPEEDAEDDQPPPEDEEEEDVHGRHGDRHDDDRDDRDDRREGDRDEHHDGHERRRSRHKSSKSRDKVPESVKKELKEFREMIQRIPGVPKPLEKATPTSYADSPFTDDIALVDIPKRFAVPSMESYDGSTDPLEHIAQYKQRMFTVPITRDLREACMCKGFGSTLEGPALQWFVNLPNESIETFVDLVDTFNLQFASSRVFKKMTNDLYRIVQRHREPLRDYLTRFNREKVTITNCDIPTAIEAFGRGLERDSPLYDDLMKYPCRIMEDVQAKAMALVKLEEDKREHDEEYYRPSRKITTARIRDYKPYD